MRRPLALLVVAALSAAVLAPAASAQEVQHTVERVEIASTEAEDPATVVVSLFRPAGASADAPVPAVLEGHGWGGSRRTTVSSVARWLDAGYGVVSIDQRGFGESGGQAGAMDPDNEGRDLLAVMDHVAALDWVATEQSDTFERDPVVGAIGGSYGGGYQMLLSLLETRLFGETRLDALAPEITWFDLNDSLAPSDVPRTVWSSLLYAAAANRVESYITHGFVYGATTGMYADGTVPGFDLKGEFSTHGPAWYVRDGIRLDVPVLLRQGFSDNLFNFNQAWHNYFDVLTDRARAQSTLVGYNGGHVLPNVLPPGEAAGGDACSGPGGFTARTLEFFDVLLKGEGADARVVGDGQPLHYTTVDGDRCLRLDEPAALVGKPVVELDPTGTLGPAHGNVTVAGAPLSLEIPGTEGVTIGGVPTIDGDLYSVGVDARVFVTLSRGTSPQDATVIQNNVLPIRVFGPASTGTEVDGFELPGVAAELAEDERLYLTISPMSDMYIGHGSRTPGGVGITDLTVNLPIVEE